MDKGRHHIGRVPVAIYIAVEDSRAGQTSARLSRTFAHARNWDVRLEVADIGPTVALGERPGWHGVAQAISLGAIRGIVTWSREMVIEPTADLAVLCARLGKHGVFLTVGSGGREADQVAGEGAAPRSPRATARVPPRFGRASRPPQSD